MGRHATDLSGFQGKYFTVLRRIGTYRLPSGSKSGTKAIWLCRCVCGTEFASISPVLLTRRETMSCGCMRRRDNHEYYELTGKTLPPE